MAITEKTPDYWVPLHITNIHSGEEHIKIFAYWCNSKYWRISSKVALMSYKDETSTFTTVGGSLYICHTYNKKCTKEMRNLIEAWIFSKTNKYEVIYDLYSRSLGSTKHVQ